MKSVDEVFNWLIKNSYYYRILYDCNSIKEMCERYIDKTDDISVRVGLYYTPPFHVPLEDFLKFMETKKYSYKKLLKPIVDAKLIRIIECNDKIWDSGEGLVQDSQGKRFVRYWLNKPIHDEEGEGYCRDSYTYCGEPVELP